MNQLDYLLLTFRVQNKTFTFSPKSAHEIRKLDYYRNFAYIKISETQR